MQKTVIEQESKYDILRNSAGELLFIIRARLTNEEKPTIIYDGGEHAILYRNSNNTIVLDYINPNVRQNLTKSTKVLVVEAQGSSIVREYFSSVKSVEKVPLPEIQTI
ncbi:MAG: hypothetical protein IJY92_05755 [Alphaproteobacteria bacterium]|nr:hypothetical protein [Alphaproteobacteria bacterium]